MSRDLILDMKAPCPLFLVPLFFFFLCDKSVDRNWNRLVIHVAESACFVSLNPWGLN